VNQQAKSQETGPEPGQKPPRWRTALRWLLGTWLGISLLVGVLGALSSGTPVATAVLQAGRSTGLIIGALLLVLALVYAPPVVLIRRWWAGYRRRKPFANDQREKSIARFVSNNAAMFGAVTIFYAMLVALFGYWIAPDGTPHANRQVLEIEKEQPGFSMRFLQVRTNRELPAQPWYLTLLKGRESPYREIPLSSYVLQGDSLIAETYQGKSRPARRQAFHLVDIAYGRSFSQPELRLEAGEYRFYDFRENEIRISRSELAAQVEASHVVKRRFWLGTDQEGRDYLSRIILGTRISLSVGFLAVTVALLIGLVLGSAAGYFRGKTDDLILWFINVFWSIPTLLLVFPIAFAFGMKEWTIYLAVGLTMWVDIARIVRGQVLGVRELEYVEAARSLGFSHARIIFRHILPNISGPVIVITAANFAYAILIEAGLSFLGIGAQPPKPSWGQMIARNKDNIAYGDPLLALLPGFAIVLLVLSFFLIGNGLRDALDARTRLEH
jgi:peptide/nickel transport system permease protein